MKFKITKMEYPEGGYGDESFIHTDSNNRAREIRSILLKVATQLLHSDISEYADDWDVKVPQRVLKKIEEHNEHLKSLAVALKMVSDLIK